MITEGKRSEIQGLCDKLRGKTFEAFLRDICRVDSLEELTDENNELLNDIMRNNKRYLNSLRDYLAPELVAEAI